MTSVHDELGIKEFSLDTHQIKPSKTKSAKTTYDKNAWKYSYIEPRTTYGQQYAPTNISSDMIDNAKNISSIIANIYSSVPKNEGISSDDRYYIDNFMSILYNKPVNEISRNHSYYTSGIFGTDIEDKTFLKAITDSFLASNNQKKLASLQLRKDKLDADDPQALLLEEQMQKLEKEIQIQQIDPKDRFFLEDWTKGAASYLGQNWKNMTVQTAILIGSAALAPATGGASLIAGTPLGSGISKALTFFDTTATEAGLASREIEKLMDQHGNENKMDPTARKALATMIGMANGFVEIMFDLPGVQKFMATGGAGNFLFDFLNDSSSNVIGKFMTSKLFSLIAEHGTEALTGAFGEALEEYIQSFVGDAGLFIAKKISNANGTDFDVSLATTISNGLKNAFDSYTETLGPSFIFSLGGSVSSDIFSLADTTALKETFSNHMGEFATGDKKAASKMQNVDNNTTVVSSDAIDAGSKRATKDYSKDEKGNETKIDPIKVTVDVNAEYGSFLKPINEAEAEKAKFLKEHGQEDIAVQVVPDVPLSMNGEEVERLANTFGGTFENNEIVFSSDTQRQEFERKMSAIGVFPVDGSLKISDGENTRSIAISTASDNATVRISRNAQMLSEKIQKASNGSIDSRGADLLGELMAKIAEAKGYDVSKLSIESEKESGIDLKAINGKATGAHVEESLRMILSDDADETTVDHEGFHIMFELDADSRNNLIKEIKTTLLDEKEKQVFREFLEDNKDVFPDEYDADNVIDVLSALPDDGNLTEDQTEAITYLHSAWMKNTDSKKLSKGIRAVFQKIQKIFREIYDTVTSKQLNKNIDNAFAKFYKKNKTNTDSASKEANSKTESESESEYTNPNQDPNVLLQIAVRNEGSLVDGKNKGRITKDDVIKMILAGAYVPETILQRFENDIFFKEDRILKIERSDRNIIEKLYKAGLNTDYATLNGFLEAHAESLGDLWNDNIERVLRKAYLYANVKTAKEMEDDFIKRHSTLQGLLDFKKIYSLRRITNVDENGNVRTSVYIPENSYVYQKLQGINIDSSEEDVKAVIDDIKANPEIYLKAELRAKKDYLRRDALVEDSPNYMVTIAQLQYLTQMDTKAMAGVEDFLLSMDKNLDETNLADAIKESQERGTIAEGGDFNNMHLDQGYYGVADPDFAASVKGFYESLIEELKDKSDLDKQRALDALENKLTKQIEREQRKNAKTLARLEAVKLKRKRDKAVMKLKRDVKRNSSKDDAIIHETVKYLTAYLNSKGDVEEYERQAFKRGFKNDWDSTTITATYTDDDAIGEIIESISTGLYGYVNSSIPSLLQKFLAEPTLNKLKSGVRLSGLDMDDMANLSAAVAGAKAVSRQLYEKRLAEKQNERNNMVLSAMESVIKIDGGIPVEALKEQLKEETSRISEFSDEQIAEMRKDRKRVNKFLQSALTWDIFNEPNILNAIGNKAVGAVAGTYGHPQDVFKMLDGGKEGTWYNTFVFNVQKQLDKMQGEINRRNDSAYAGFKRIADIDLGNIKQTETGKKNIAWLNQKFEIQNVHEKTTQTLTGAQLIHVYMGAQNINGFIKLVGPKANGISLYEMARINPEYTIKYIDESLSRRSEPMYLDENGNYVSILKEYSYNEFMQIKDGIRNGTIKPMLPEFAMKLGDFMIDELENETKRLNTTCYEVYGHPFVEQQRYFPIVHSGNAIEFQIGKDMDYSNSNVNTPFLKERRLDDSHSMLLDPFNVFFKAIQMQERFLELGKTTSDLNFMLSSNGGNMREILSEKYGSGMGNFLDMYMSAITGNKNASDGFDRFFMKGISNMAAAKIAYNLGTVLRQLGSYLVSTMDGEIGIGDLISSTAYVVSNYSKALEEYNRLAPDTAKHSMESAIEAFEKKQANNPAVNARNTMLDIGMKGTEFMDKLVKVIAWKASFDKNIEKGLSEDDASARASLLVKRTQSIADPASMSVIQNMNNPILKMLFLFTNDSFQMWNVATLGIASDIKNKNYVNIAKKVMVISAAAGFSALLSGEFGDKDDDDNMLEHILKVLAKNSIQYIPVIGVMLSNAIDGYTSNIISDVFNAISSAIQGSEKIAENKKKGKNVHGYEYWDAFDDLAKIVSESFGLPFTAARRATKVAFPEKMREGADFELGNFAYLIGNKIGDQATGRE